VRKALIGVLSFGLAAGLAVSAGGPAVAGPDQHRTGPVTGRGHEGPQASNGDAGFEDELPNQLEDKRRELRQRALHLVLTGQRKVETINGAQVVRVGKKPAALTAAQRAQVRAGQKVTPRRVDQYVELSREKTDKIFVILTEFGDQRDPRFPDKDTDPLTPGPATFAGPAHNAIPEPDRRVDNSTIWQKDFSADYFRKLYFGTGAGVESLKTYYEKQSSGRYSVDGMVTDWVKVKYNEARYGRSDDPKADDDPSGDPAVCASNVCSNTWDLLGDGLKQWTADQKAQGRTAAQIKASLASYDQQDRYDYDGDGNFNEPDGYLDHFQVVHSGGDQADGDPYQGEDAIWSHRWYAFGNQQGQTGPATNKLGGIPVGDTGLWVGDYTIQPENGGLSVFAHEFGHDLGLPDHYDTQASGDNPVSWWTLMAQSRARAKNDVGIGTRPADLGVWDKLQLQWLDYETAIAGQKKTFKLGPHEYNSKKAQGLVVVLPKKQVTSQLVAPATGTRQWWSGSADGLTNSLTRTVSLPTGPASLTFQANYDIETGFDYAQVQVDDGSGWASLPSNLSTVKANNGIDGSTKNAYVQGTVDLSAYAGKTVQLRFLYTTDGGAAGNDAEAGNNGLFLDDITLTADGNVVFSDGAETVDPAWTAVGFSAVGSSLTRAYAQYYLASNRTYTSYDRYLKTGPYNFGNLAEQPDKVEFFPYQRGLLVNYWDESQTDNNTSQHPGAGLVLPIDSHPQAFYGLDGNPLRGRIQTYDAPFSLRKAASFTLHVNGVPAYVRGQAGNPLFDDTRSYLDPALPRVGVQPAGVGVTLRVTAQKGTSMTVKLGTSKSVSATKTLASARRGD
jgi:immune inhibitor A